MNEPTNFFVEPAFGVNSLVNWNHLRCPINGADGKYDNPRYATWASYIYEEELFTHTLCSLGKVAAGKYNLYDTHNLYGLRMTTYMHEVHDKILKTRGAVISRSTFPSAGRYSGHFLGQNSALWEDLQTSIIGIIEFNIFGIPFVGADICGYSANSNEELCIRWHQLGAFYPLSRNYNGPYNKPHHPTYSTRVGSAAKRSLLFKYHYLPYLYTLFYLANRNGGTVIRPLFFEFPTDVSTYDISYQFMWGSGMLVAPVVSKGRKTVDAYFPPSATWYSLREKDYGTAMNKTSSNVKLYAGWDEVAPVFARGDVIIPRQAPAQFLRDARNQPFELLITLEANDKEVIRNASGSLYWDDGESFMGEDYYFLRFSFTANNYFATLTISHSHSGKVHIPTLDIIEIFGYSYFPDFSTITFSGFPLKVNQTTFCAQTNILRMQGTRMIDWSAPGIIQLMWNHSRISTTTPAATSARTSATTITILSDTQSSPETVTPTSELTIATSTQMIKTAQTLTVFTATSTESTQSLTSTKISAGTISEAETTGQTSTTTALISRTESAAPPTTVSTHAPGMQSSTTRQSSVITVSELKTTMWTTTAAMPTSQPTTTVRPMKTKEPQHTDRPTAVSFSTMTGLPTASSYETGERVSLPEMVESTSGSSEATGESQMMGGSAAPPTTTLASPKSKILVAFLFSVLSFILKVF